LLRPAPIVAALPANTPFVGPERIMRERGLSELLRLGANESAFGPAPSAIAAMAGELERTAWYGDPDSLDLRDALARKHDCTPEHISIGSGIDDLMGLAVRAFVAPGAVAVTSRGTYPTFDYHVAGYGGTLVRVPYRSDDRPDLDGLAAAAHATSAAMVYLANPDNPSGTFYAAGEIARFRAALPKETMFFLDEAYADFVEPSELIPNAFDLDMLRTRTFSKAYGMAGLRQGYAIGHPETLKKMRQWVGSSGTGSLNVFGMAAATASIQQDADGAFSKNERMRNKAVRDMVSKWFNDRGMKPTDAQANFMFVNIGTPARAFRDACRAKGVIVARDFPPFEKTHARISLGTMEEMTKAVQVFGEVLAKKSTAAA